MKKVLLSSVLAAGACAMFSACSGDSTSPLSPPVGASSSSVVWEEQSSSSVGQNSDSSNPASSSADVPLSSAMSSSNVGDLPTSSPANSSSSAGNPTSSATPNSSAVVQMDSRLLNLTARLRPNTPRTSALRQSAVGIPATGMLASRIAPGLGKTLTM